MTSPRGRGRKTPELTETAELKAPTSAGLSHLTVELGSPSRPTLVVYFQHRRKPLLRGLWSGLFSFFYLVFPLMSWFQVEQPSSSHRLLLCTSDLNPFQGWFAFHKGSVKPVLPLPSQARLGCMTRRFPQSLSKAPEQRLGCEMAVSLEKSSDRPDLVPHAPGDV